jgi:hypothetical protein
MPENVQVPGAAVGQSRPRGVVADAVASAAARVLAEHRRVGDVDAEAPVGAGRRRTEQRPFAGLGRRREDGDRAGGRVAVLVGQNAAGQRRRVRDRSGSERDQKTCGGRARSTATAA